MADRKVKTMSLSGNDYAKVADRLLEFRSDWPNSKIETHRVTNDDKTVEFVSYIWKDKTDLIELMKSGVTDPEILRASADSNGSAMGMVGVKTKDYEKLETIANGRALANIGYAGSGEIASFEEMNEFHKYQDEQKEEAIMIDLGLIANAATLDELKKLFLGSNFKNVKAIVEAKDKRKAELES